MRYARAQYIPGRWLIVAPCCRELSGRTGVRRIAVVDEPAASGAEVIELKEAPGSGRLSRKFENIAGTYSGLFVRGKYSGRAFGIFAALKIILGHYFWIFLLHSYHGVEGIFPKNFPGIGIGSGGFNCRKPTICDEDLGGVDCFVSVSDGTVVADLADGDGVSGPSRQPRQESLRRLFGWLFNLWFGRWQSPPLQSLENRQRRHSSLSL